MTQRCHTPEEITELAELGPDDPRRAHLDACPRCQAVLLSFREFLRAEPLPAGARPAQASEQLDRVLQAEILGPPSLAAASRQDAPEGGRWWDRLAGRLRPPVLAPALAGAAVVALLVLLLPGRTPTEPARELRGASSEAASQGGDDVRDLIWTETTALAEGGWLLEWRLPSGADRAEVILYASDLSELLRREFRDEQQWRLATPAGGEAGWPAGARYWRVLGLQGAEEIARSTLQAIGQP